ncbi:hypothetical protein DFJ73DRAFT_888494 [Zopfochytrium polystomum]|nr:hypothetical protein DFJ73DRAFT_888494 [Zopfochytrium polystomum]
MLASKPNSGQIDFARTQILNINAAGDTLQDCAFFFADFASSRKPNINTREIKKAASSILSHFKCEMKKNLGLPNVPKLAAHDLARSIFTFEKGRGALSIGTATVLRLQIASILRYYHFLYNSEFANHKVLHPRHNHGRDAPGAEEDLLLPDVGVDRKTQCKFPAYWTFISCGVSHFYSLLKEERSATVAKFDGIIAMSLEALTADENTAVVGGDENSV